MRSLMCCLLVRCYPFVWGGENVCSAESSAPLISGIDSLEVELGEAKCEIAIDFDYLGIDDVCWLAK